ncbi:MAG: alpha/beta hydrolase [Syntrophomonadaceae bacterium]|jgi:pimeloyl-ACP methyl ester carboxylesterase|nr:alpha/beta hydrolase [Syntrophomonadaceae bacterium]
MLNYDYIPGTEGTLIFVHGAGGSLKKWRRQMSELPEDFGGLAFDLPGHGLSAGQAPDAVTTYAAAAVDCVRSAAPPRPYIWLGHSLGGAIVLTVALEYPDMLDYQILIGSGARLRVAPENLAKLKQGIVDPDIKCLAFSPSTGKELIKAEIEEDMKTPPSVSYNALLACDKFDVMDSIAKIGAETLLLVGKEDLSTPPKYSEYLLNKLPHANLEIIEQAGHMVMLEQPSVINKHICQFVREAVK